MTLNRSASGEPVARPATPAKGAFRANGLAPGQPDGVAAEARAASARPTILEILAFGIPAFSFLQIALVGRLIASEVLALAVLPWLLRERDRIAAPRWILVLWAAWFASQIATDLLVRSAFGDLARGWAAIAFTLVNLLAILTLAGTVRRARIFALGIAVGGVLGYVFAPDIYAASDPWKWAFAIPIGYVLAASMSGDRAARTPWLGIILFAAFGVLNAFLQFRALSGVSLITAVYLLAGWVLGPRIARLRSVPLRVGVGIGAYGVAAVGVFLALSLAAASGLLGDAAKSRYDAQTGIPTAPPGSASPGAASPGPIVEPPDNPLAVIAGGRAEILSSPHAILDSPIIGHGSWARDPKYVELQRQGLIDLNIPGGNAPSDPTLIPTHSYLLGSWVWAGLAGGVFWFAIACLALWAVIRLFGSSASQLPLIVFVASWLLWNIAFSPYANTERIFSMYAVVVLLLALREPRFQRARTPA
jgi:hypothetical protein